jgi:3D (Asp-Asp-Asp) domain-containing protein
MKSEFPNLRKKSLIPSFLADKIILLLIFILFFDFILYPAPILAEQNSQTQNTVEQGQITQTAATAESTPETLIKPKEKENKVIKSGFYEMTAYTSEVAQCDSSPCITANGFNVCKHGIEDTIAANFLKFGTKVKIPELYGDRIFIVRDRMNKRYNNRVDIWMKDKNQAIKFGFKLAKIEILQ